MDRMRELRARLLELHGAVKGYFEATVVGVGAGYFSAFDALRRNQHLAESFVSDLQALLEHIEREVAPALGPTTGAARTVESAPARAAEPTRPTATSQSGAIPTINDEQTMLLARLPDNVQAEAMRFLAESRAAPREASRPPAAGAPATRAAAPAPSERRGVSTAGVIGGSTHLPTGRTGERVATVTASPDDPSLELDDGDDSLLQEIRTDPELEKTPAPVGRGAQPGPSPGRGAAAPASAARPSSGPRPTAAPPREEPRSAPPRAAAPKEEPRPGPSRAAPKEEPRPAAAPRDEAGPARGAPLPGLSGPARAAQPSPAAPRPMGSLAARIAAVTQAAAGAQAPAAATAPASGERPTDRGSTERAPASERPAERVPASERPAERAPSRSAEPAREPAPPARPAAAPRPAAAAPRPAAPAPKPAPERPRSGAKQSGRHRTGQVPQFDESDLTDPGFTMDKGPQAGKKR